MNLLVNALVFLFLLGVELAFIWIARKINLLDTPNHRSSHHIPTLRGGGIIFVMAALLYQVLASFQLIPGEPLGIMTMSALLLLAIVSFMDDVMSLSSILRFTMHSISVAFLIIELSLLEIVDVNWILLGGFFFTGVAVLNAFNFMDGINGITSSYSIVLLLFLLYLNKFVILYTSSQFIIFIILSIIVFMIFNFRIESKLFAGDVGSITISFLILYLVYKLIFVTDDYIYLLVFLLYGVDTGITFLSRLIKKESLFLAHRTHVYQLLTQKYKQPLLIALSYAFIQAIICYFIVSVNQLSSIWKVLLTASLISFFVVSLWITRERLIVELDD